ncbi:hypothetical protein NL676_008309 [Syzygium grande]|nr:hypothetical protein NL676_008309 [Syzygium grande]
MQSNQREAEARPVTWQHTISHLFWRSPVTVPSPRRDSSADSLSTTATDQSSLKSATENSPNESGVQNSNQLRHAKNFTTVSDPPAAAHRRRIENISRLRSSSSRNSLSAARRLHDDQRGNEGISSAAASAEIRGREDPTCAARENSGRRKPSSQLSPRAETELLFRASMKLSRRRSSLKSEGGGHERMVTGGDQAEVSTRRMMRADTYGSLIRGVSVFNLEKQGTQSAAAMDRRRPATHHWATL